MSRRPIEPLRARAAEELRKLLAAPHIRALADVVGDPVLSCTLIVTRARIGDLLRDEGKDRAIRNVVASFLKVIDAATRGSR